MQVLSAMTRSVSRLGCDPDYRRMLESHMGVLRTLPTTERVPVAPEDAYLWQGNLHGYLNHLRIIPDTHWVVMRMNQLWAPTEFGPQVTSLLIPHDEVIRQIRQRYLTIKKKLT